MLSFEAICVLSGVAWAALDGESCHIHRILHQLTQSAQSVQKIATFMFSGGILHPFVSWRKRASDHSPGKNDVALPMYGRLLGTLML